MNVVRLLLNLAATALGPNALPQLECFGVSGRVELR
jgi:hypothetical protein